MLMGFKPSTALLYKAQAQRAARANFAASQLTRKLAAEQAFTGMSKRTAKKDRHTCQKARAWRCKGTFAVSAKQVKLSKIDWI